LASAIERTLAEPVPHHTFDLNGVAATRGLVEALGNERR
jgi:hypothetical protein